MIENLYFRRLFSVNPFRTLSLPMGEMSFYKDWAHDGRGDPYPVLCREGDFKEETGNGKWRVFSESGGRFDRFLCGFFPWHTYTVSLDELKNASFVLRVLSPRGPVALRVSGDGRVSLSDPTGEKAAGRLSGALAFSVSFRTNGVSVFNETKKGGASLILDTDLPLLSDLRDEALFRKTVTSVGIEAEAGGTATVSEVKTAIVSGMSHADPKPVRYEDGTVMTENGRVFLTVSAREGRYGFETVVSWLPGTADFRMEGALFFSYGDGAWCADVASSILFDRRTKKWLLWVCSFSHGHRLARAAFDADPRYGVNVIDAMPMAYGNGDRLGFEAIQGDEDPDLIYYEGKWHLAVCRLMEDGGYHYLHFVSDDPTGGFSYADRTPGKEKTGGLFVKTADGVDFVCGSDFGKRAVYDTCPIADFSDRRPLQCDYDDGGFRGWGTVMAIPKGTRTAYYWLTFDRHNCSDYNWSYGNLYVYEA